MDVDCEVMHCSDAASTLGHNWLSCGNFALFIRFIRRVIHMHRVELIAERPVLVNGYVVAIDSAKLTR